MRPDKNYINKIDILREFFHWGWVFQSLQQMSIILGYANKAWAKLFLQKLVKEWILENRENSYLPTNTLIWFPLFESVRAGLPFTPESHPTKLIDMKEYLIDHPSSTYFVRVRWDSMKDAGIIEWDIVLLDRSLSPKNWDIVIASLDWDVTLKYFEKNGDNIRLIPANSEYLPIVIDGPFELLGVVCGSIRKYS